MKFTKLVHWTEINALFTVKLQIFRKINVLVIEIKKYLSQNYTTC